jgi:hypothetical protein
MALDSKRPRREPVVVDLTADDDDEYQNAATGIAGIAEGVGAAAGTGDGDERGDDSLSVVGEDDFEVVPNSNRSTDKTTGREEDEVEHIVVSKTIPMLDISGEGDSSKLTYVVVNKGL